MPADIALPLMLAGSTQAITTRPILKAQTIRQRFTNCQSRPPADVVDSDVALGGTSWPGGNIFVNLPWHMHLILRLGMWHVNRTPMRLQRCLRSVVETTAAIVNRFLNANG
jgi:hypothetical protein